MEDKIIIPKINPDSDKNGNSCVVRIFKKCMALINNLCAETNRTQQDIANRLIEFAYDRCEITEECEDDDT